MPLDDRLREGLRQAAERIEPDVGLGLTMVESRARRRGAMGLGSLVGAAAVMILIVVGLQAVRSLPADGPGGPPSAATPTAVTASPSDYARVSGTYVVTLQAADGNAGTGDVAGEWTMTLDPDGTMRLSPPPTFEEGGAVQSGVAFSVEEDRLRTNLFQQRCDSIGAYRWRLVDERLILTVEDDGCALRAAVLGARPWQRK